MTVYGGDDVEAADINGILAMLPKNYVKTGGTRIASSATNADDPDLAAIHLEPGVYDIELLGFFTVDSTTSPAGIKTSWRFTGTATAGTLRNCIGPGTGNTGSTVAVSTMTSGAFTMTQSAPYNAATVSAYAAFRERCANFTVTVAGDLYLQWSQITSSTNGTTFRPESMFRVQKIA